MSDTEAEYSHEYIDAQWDKLPQRVRECYPGHPVDASPEHRASILIAYLEKCLYRTEKVLAWAYKPKGSLKTFYRYVFEYGQYHGSTELEAVVKAAKSVKWTGEKK